MIFLKKIVAAVFVSSVRLFGICLFAYININTLLPARSVNVTGFIKNVSNYFSSRTRFEL